MSSVVDVTRKSGRHNDSRRRIGIAVAAIACAAFLQVSNLPLLNDAGTGIAYAQNDDEDGKPKKPDTRKANTVTEKVGKQIVAAQEALAAERYAEALGILQRLQNNSSLKPYESAVVWRLTGFVYVSMDNPPRYADAIRAFERAASYKAFDGPQQLQLDFYLGQLYLAEGRVDEAIRKMETVVRETPDFNDPQGYYILAQAYMMKEQFSRALTNAETMMRLARASGATPRETFFGLAANLYLQNQKYRNAQTLLREIVALFPGKKRYWTQLGATYSLLEQEKNAYYFKYMMYQQNMLTTSNELTQMASLHIFHDVPYRGVKTMNQGFGSSQIETTKKNYELLARSYQGSREWKAAIQPLTRAAGLSDDGNIYVQLCQSYMNERQYAKAQTACERALNAGGLRNRGSTLMLLGSIHYARDNFESALTRFRQASRIDSSRSRASQWVQFIENEIADRARRAAAEEARKKKIAEEEAAAEAGRVR